MSWRDRKRGREIITDRATLQVPRVLASWSEQGSPNSEAWKVPDYLEVVECKVEKIEEDECLEATVIRSKYCAASLRIDKQCAVRKGDWCDHCDLAAQNRSALLNIVKLVKNLDRLAIAEDKMMPLSGGMHRCIRKAQNHEYFDDGKILRAQWLHPCLVKDDYWQDLAKCTIDQDKDCLMKMRCVPKKNEAFARIVEYNLTLLMTSSMDS